MTDNINDLFAKYGVQRYPKKEPIIQKNVPSSQEVSPLEEIPLTTSDVIVDAFPQGNI